MSKSHFILKTNGKRVWGKTCTSAIYFGPHTSCTLMSIKISPEIGRKSKATQVIFYSFSLNPTLFSESWVCSLRVFHWPMKKLKISCNCLSLANRSPAMPGGNPIMELLQTSKISDCPASNSLFRGLQKSSEAVTHHWGSSLICVIVKWRWSDQHPH